jgi:hypothetical protein
MTVRRSLASPLEQLALGGQAGRRIAARLRVHDLEDLDVGEGLTQPTQRGQPDEAAQLGIAALRSVGSWASTLGWFVELDTVLRKDHAGIGEVEDFQEQYVLARRSMHDGRMER